MVNGEWNKAVSIHHLLFTIHRPLPSAFGAAHGGVEEAGGVEEGKGLAAALKSSVFGGWRGGGGGGGGGGWGGVVGFFTCLGSNRRAGSRTVRMRPRTGATPRTAAGAC